MGGTERVERRRAIRVGPGRPHRRAIVLAPPASAFPVVARPVAGPANRALPNTTPPTSQAAA